MRTKGDIIHDWIERNTVAMLVLIVMAVSVGSIITTVPLFYLNNTWEDSEKFPELAGVRPYTPLEFAGRDVYIREGCYTCHSQMVRPFRDELMRYGHYSLAVESKYDHPFQWGSKRTGPDLARVGGKYSDEWHVAHLIRPQDLVPESVMPGYPWLMEAQVDADSIPTKLAAMKMMGVPYSQEDIDTSADAVRGKTEMEALVAYMQMLGTMIEFKEGRAYRD